MTWWARHTFTAGVSFNAISEAINSLKPGGDFPADEQLAFESAKGALGVLIMSGLVTNYGDDGSEPLDVPIDVPIRGDGDENGRTTSVVVTVNRSVALFRHCR